jgi:hypothetical protein
LCSVDEGWLTFVLYGQQVKKVEDVVYDLSLRGLLPKEQDTQKEGKKAAPAPASDMETET